MCFVFLRQPLFFFYLMLMFKSQRNGCYLFGHVFCLAQRLDTPKTTGSNLRALLNLRLRAE